MASHSNDSRIERVALLGGAADQAAIDRRTALGMFCLGVGTLLGRNALGATDASVGVAGEGFMFDSPFRAVGAVRWFEPLLDPKTQRPMQTTKKSPLA
jgi:hypothetical protein